MSKRERYLTADEIRSIRADWDMIARKFNRKQAAA